MTSPTCIIWVDLVNPCQVKPANRRVNRSPRFRSKWSRLDWKPYQDNSGLWQLDSFGVGPVIDDLTSSLWPIQLDYVASLGHGLGPNHRLIQKSEKYIKKTVSGRAQIGSKCNFNFSIINRVRFSIRYVKIVKSRDT